MTVPTQDEHHPNSRVHWIGDVEPTDAQDRDVWTNPETGGEYLRVDGKWIPVW